MKNRYFNTFIHKVTSIDKKEPKICISKFPSEILFYLIHYVRNHWEGGYKGVLFVKEGIRLHRRVFTNSIDTQNCVFEEQVEFYNCIFESLEIKQVSFQKGITIEEQTEFYNCIFESLKIKQVSFQKGITFEKCKFEEQTEFYNCIFESLKIKQVFFQKSITFEGCKLGIRPPDDKGILGEKLPIAVFEGVIFQSDIKYFITHCDSLYFKKCKFEGDININDTEIDNQVVFLDCNFYKDCDFKDIEFKGETSFKGCKFNNRYSKIDFSGCTFNTADFSNTEFIGDLDFSLREEVNGDVKGVVFKNYVDFKNSKIKKAGFKGVIFQNNVYFEGAVLENIDFSGAKFVEPEKDTYIKENQRKEINFSRVLFGTLSFENTLFEKNVRFHESTFEKKANFENTTFEKLVDFHGAIFNEAQPFHFTDFSEEAIFANVKFKKEVQFLYCKIKPDSYIRFESSIFERGLEISRSNFRRNINFWDITIDKEGEQEIFRNLNNQHYKDIKYIDDFGKYPTKEVPMVYRQIRETYRIIKDDFYAQNNRIEGLKFYEKEMSVYLEEKRLSKTKKEEKHESNCYKKFKGDKIFYSLIIIMVITIILWECYKYFIFYIILIISFVLVLVERWYKNKEKLKTKNPLKQNNYFSFIFLIIGIIFYLIWIREVMNTIDYMGISYIFLFFSAAFLYFYQERDRIILWFNKNSNSFGTDWVAGVNFTLLIALISTMIILSMTPHIVFSFDIEVQNQIYISNRFFKIEFLCRSVVDCLLWNSVEATI